MTRGAKKWLTLGFVAVVAVVVAVFIWWFQRPELPPGIAAANGRLEATEVDIATKRAGRLADVLAREGDMVGKGEEVARMDVRDLEANLRQAQAELQEAVDAKSASEARLAQQESEVEFAAAEFKRSETLVKQKLISQQQADLTRTKLQSAQAGVNAARASVTQADAAINAAQAKMDAIQTDLDDSVLRSPIVGRVLYRLAEPGEVLAVGGKILTLVDLTDVYMTVFLPTVQAGRVQLGSEARIVFDARPDLVIPAQVSFLSPEAQFTPKQVETQAEREKLMFRLRVRIDPKLLEQHIERVRTGLPGMVYVRVDPDAEWPEHLQPPPELL